MNDLYFAWEIIDICDLACPHCYSAGLHEHITATRYQKLLPVEKIHQGLKNLKNTDLFRFVGFSGGEPTLRKDIVEILKCSKELGFQTHCSTHGMHLLRGTPCLAERFAENLDVLAISCDGADEISDEKIRLRHNLAPSGHFKLFRTFLDWYRRKKPNYRLKINTVIMRPNLAGVAEIGELITDIPDIQWKLIEFIPLGLGVKNEQNLTIPHEQYLETVQYLKTRYPEINITTRKHHGSDVYPLLIALTNGSIVIPHGRRHKPVMVDSRQLNVLHSQFKNDLDRFIKENPKFVGANRSQANTYPLLKK